jgi:hypothetical protein
MGKNLSLIQSRIIKYCFGVATNHISDVMRNVFLIIYKIWVKNEVEYYESLQEELTELNDKHEMDFTPLGIHN